MTRSVDLVLVADYGAVIIVTELVSLGHDNGSATFSAVASFGGVTTCASAPQTATIDQLAVTVLVPRADVNPARGWFDHGHGTVHCDGNV